MDKVKNKKNRQINLAFEECKIGNILNSIGEAVITLDRNFIIRTFNPIAEEMIGYKAKDVIGLSARKILKIKDEKTGKFLTWPFLEVIKKGKIIQLSNHSNLISSDKRELPISYNISPLRDSNNFIIGLIIVFRDVTKEREVQKMKSEFVSIVSHQLRTPSSAVKWYLETLLENRKGNKMNNWQIEHLQQAFQSNERMINLINDLLNVSRIESGRIKMEFTDVSITEICHSVIQEMANFSRANNVVIDCRICDKKIPLVRAEADKIRQVIQNLVNNAIKYTKRGHQKVIIDGKVKDKYLTIWVKDHGIGIPQEQQKRMFERFFRAENAIIMQTEGSGLGLYIAKKILDLHHGDIWLESKENEGTTFYFTLPLSKYSLKKYE